MVSLLDILEENKQFIILEDADDISYNDFAPELQPGEVIKIHGSIASFIARLDDELNNALRKIDPHTPEYIDRLRDELKLYAVIVKGQIWSERIEQEGFDTGGSLTRLILGRLEHIYYKVSTPSYCRLTPACISHREFGKDGLETHSCDPGFGHLTSFHPLFPDRPKSLCSPL